MARNGPKQIPPLILWIISKYKDTDSVKAKKDIKNIENSSKNLTGSLTQSLGSLAGFVKGAVGAFLSVEIVGRLLQLAKAGEESEKQWRLARQQAENAGYQWDKVGQKIESYSEKMIGLGFDDEDTMLSVTKFLGVTKDLTSAFMLNSIAMDLSKNKSIDLGEATNVVLSIIAGNTRVLKQYGINLRDNATVMEALKALMDKVKGSAASTVTPLDQLQVIIGNISEDIGKKLNPGIYSLALAVAGFINSGAGQALLTFFDFLGQQISGLASIFNGSAWQNFWINLFPKNHNEITETSANIYNMNRALEKYKSQLKELKAITNPTEDQKGKITELEKEIKKTIQAMMEANPKLASLYIEQGKFYKEQETNWLKKYSINLPPLPKVDLSKMQLKPAGKDADEFAKKVNEANDALAKLNEIINSTSADETAGSILNLTNKLDELKAKIKAGQIKPDAEIQQLYDQALSQGKAQIYKAEAQRKVQDLDAKSQGDLIAYRKELIALQEQYQNMPNGALAAEQVKNEILKTDQSIDKSKSDLNVKILELQKKELDSKLAALAVEMDVERKKNDDIAALDEYEKLRREQIFEEVAQSWISKEQEKTGATLQEIRERIRAELVAAELNNNLSEKEINLLEEKLRLLNQLIENDETTKAKQFAKNLHDEVQSNLSDAIVTAFDEGGATGAAQLGDYIKNKVKKALADSLADALMKTLFGSSLENGLKGLFSPTGEASGGLFGKLFGGSQADQSGTNGGGFGGAINKFMGSTWGKALGGLGMGAMMNGGQMGAGGALGTALGMFLPGIGPMLGGMLGGVIDSIFGGSDKNITIQANEGKIEADYLEANFKEGIITLSSVYKDQTLDPRRETPAPVYSVNVYVEGSVIAERNLGQTIQGAAVEGIKKAEAKVGSWQPSKIKK